VDYQYSAHQTDRVAANNPANGQFNLNNVFELPQTSVLSMRAGVKWSGLDLSAFVNNVSNSQPTLAQTLSGGQGPVPSLYQYSTLRPRTYGITAAYHY
jgi:hypothetical protein